MAVHAIATDTQMKPQVIRETELKVMFLFRNVG